MSIRITLKKDIYKVNRQHYLKWDLPKEGTSIRFYFITSPKNIGNYRKFVLKNHLTKKLISLTREEALPYLEIPGVFDTQKEIVSHFVSSRNTYIKYEITDNSITEIQEKTKDTIYSKLKLVPSILSRITNSYTQYFNKKETK